MRQRLRNAGAIGLVMMATVASAADPGMMAPTTNEAPGRSAITWQVRVDPQRIPAPLTLFPEPPRLTDDARQRLEKVLERTHRLTPMPGPAPGSGVLPEALPLPPGPPSEAGGGAFAPAPQGSESFLMPVNTDLGAGAPSGFTSVVNEPSVAKSGQVIFQTGNWYAALSTDGGSTFAFVNPFAAFPPVNNGFCCDQVTIYDASRNAIYWLLQYVNDSVSGTQRIAVDVGANGTFDCYYDLTPQVFGFPSGRWLDFPDLVLGQNHLYHTTNVFRTSDDGFAGAVVARYPLDPLASCSRLESGYFSSTTQGSFRATHGATTVMYWATHNSQAQIRIFGWAETSPTVSWNDVNHAAFTSANRTTAPASCPGPDGRNWCGRTDSRVLTAWLANGVLGFMWNARQDVNYPYPHVRSLKLSESTRGLLSESAIWSPTHAWLYPSVAVNSRGHLGGTVAVGGGLLHPSCAAWIADDVNGGALAPLENYLVVAGQAGPESPQWGDYLTARRDSPNGQVWAATCYSLQGGGSNANARPRLVRFGRERDLAVTMPAARDFDGDGRADILWLHTSGAVSMWLMNGLSVASGAALAPVSQDWRDVGVADFDGDGRADILWRDGSKGVLTVWLMDGPSVVGAAALGGVSTDWGVAGARDFSGDGKADILWRHSSGAMAMWLMNGLSVAGGAALDAVPPGWDVAGVGDFNGDGKADILWRHSDGSMTMWLMDGVSVASRAALEVVPPGWDVAGVADFSGDGKADILWRHSSGAMAMWLTNGLNVTGGAALDTVPVGWTPR